MTEDDFLRARDLIAGAMERAKIVLQYISGIDETAQLDILENGDACITSWRATSDGYDGYELDKEEQCFPARLLFCPIEDVEAWRVEEKKRQAAESEAWQREASRQREAQELATLAALKAKYEPVK